MALKPEFSIMAGLAVGAVVLAVQSQATPSMADIAALPAGTPDIERAQRRATIMSGGIVAGISLIAKDPTIFVIGAVITIGATVWAHHANWTESIGGKYLSPQAASAAGSANTGPAPVEVEDYHMFQSDYAR